MSRQIVVDIIGDASKFNKSVDQAITKTGTITGKLKGVGKGMVLGAGMASFNLLSGAVDNAIGFLGEAAQAFREDEVSAKLLETALRNNIPEWDGNTDAIEAYAAAQGRLGFTDDEVRASLGQLVGVTKDATKATELNAIAQDLARAKGIPLADATDIVTKAYLGSGKALKGMGIDAGGAKTGVELLDAVQKNVKGSAEEWAATNEGKLAVSNVKVQESMEKIGKAVDKVSQVVMPALADAFSWFVNEGIPAMERGWRKLTSAIKPVTDAVSGLIDHLRNAIDLVARLANPTSSSGGNSGYPLKFEIGRGWVIPGSASGGWVGMNGPELRVVGERGPEYVVPNGGGTGRGSGLTVVVNGNIYGPSGVDELMDMMARRLRLDGV